VWYLLQSLIVSAVIWSDIHYQWTEPQAAFLIAVFCAFAATALLGDLIRFLRWLLTWKRWKRSAAPMNQPTAPHPASRAIGTQQAASRTRTARRLR
jgi:hypothetical protein